MRAGCRPLVLPQAFTAKEVEEYPYTDFLEDLAHFLDARRGDPAVAHRPEQEPSDTTARGAFDGASSARWLCVFRQFSTPTQHLPHVMPRV